MSTPNRDLALLLLAGAFAATAAVTLLPYAATKTNDFGYFSLCPFAPWSTLALAFVAGVIWVVRSYLRAQQR